MQRPSGMTALAVFNFIFAGFALFMVLILSAALSRVDALEKAARDANTAIETLKLMMYVEVAASVLDVALLIPAGIGYLRQSRTLGRLLGNLYGLAGVAYFVAVTWILVGSGGTFSLGNLSALVFPAITLLLVNVVFRQNFIR